MAPYSLYINSIKEDDIIITIIKESMKISNNLNNKGEVNNNKEE